MKPARPRPLECQITISLSAYMRESVPTIAMKRLSVSSTGKYPSTLNPITIITSDGFTTPREA
ncbi:MAG: hypothetical protein BWX79_02595 [Alphaproteobacteria bacterium ADurb.Bin100]|nr:MAG: hypothetical protein BWX79_02595 [Alphaproteobacteria bacterium ADurb.Bin100]